MEETLRDLPRHGTLIRDRANRQVWRFEAAGRPYYLKFYPRTDGRLKRMFRGNPAMREFQRLQMLQKAQIPSPRATACLVGFQIDGKLGDAVVSEAIEPSVQLDQYLSDLDLRAEPIPRQHELAAQIVDLVRRLGTARLGHADLHLGNILLRDGQLYLLDAYAVRPQGLKMDDLLLLGHSVTRFATTRDLLRGWQALEQPGEMPRRNRVSPRQWRKLVERSVEENPWFGRIKTAGWSGHFFKKHKFPRRWAPASDLQISKEDWQTLWPDLAGKIESRQLPALKRSRSGDVYSTEIHLNGRTIPVVIKRPYKRYWYRYINEIGRGSRARRAWIKAWRLIARNIPTAWPLLILEKRTLGYVTDNLIIFEKIDGPTLASINLDELDETSRDMLFRRTGRILRQIDQQNLSHFDAKSSNWIVQNDAITGPRPILIDVDGVRSRRWAALGIQRLLRSMREHPQYTPADSLALCQGYAPYSGAEIIRPSFPSPDIPSFPSPGTPDEG